MLFYENGIKGYVGEWKNDLSDGYGEFYYKNGKIEYKGNWKNGYHDGEGISYNLSGIIKHSGYFKEGIPSFNQFNIELYTNSQYNIDYNKKIRRNKLNQLNKNFSLDNIYNL